MFAGERIIPKVISGKIHYDVISPDGIIANLSRRELINLSTLPEREALSKMLLESRLSDPVQRFISY